MCAAKVMNRVIPMRNRITGRVTGLIALAVLAAVLSACSGVSGPGKLFESLPATHLPDGTTYDAYNSVPPTSGPHWGAPAPWGIYGEPIPNERQIHNLEHSGVIIQYNTDDLELIRNLREFARSQSNFPCYLLVAPYPDMSSAIALTAWPGKPGTTTSDSTYLPGVLDTMEAYDEERLQAFVDAYRGQGPERIPCV